MLKRFVTSGSKARRQLLPLLMALVLVLSQTVIASAQDPDRAGGNIGRGSPSPDTAVYPLKESVEGKRGDTTFKYQPLNTIRTVDGAEALADRVIVGFEPGADRAAILGAVAGKSRAKSISVANVGPTAALVNVAGVGSLEEAVKLYSQEKGVSYVEPDYVATVSDTPNDPSIGSQYALGKMQTYSAWDVTKGSSSVKVAILDCGIYEAASTTYGPGHPDINSKVVQRVNFSSSSNSDDYCDHGTHVAGIAAAATNNGVGIAGVGRNVSVMNVKVLGDDGSGSSSGITNGIYWAADNGAKVINMSLGGAGFCSSTYQNAINYAYNKGVVVVVAAGNAGTTSYQQPASCSNLISVASTDSADAKSSFSTYGTWVKVAAPGSNIYSLNYTGGYVNKSGTSMATPQVAGLAGLVWSTGRFSTAQQVINQIQNTSDGISGTGSYWIYGRVNAYRAVAS